MTDKTKNNPRNAWYKDMKKIMDNLDTVSQRASMAESVTISGDSYGRLNFALAEVMRCSVKQHKHFAASMVGKGSQPNLPLDYSKGALNSYEEILNIIDGVLL